MKKLFAAVAGAAFVALASAASPAAAAMPVQGITTSDVSGVENVQYRPKRHMRRKVCTMKRVVQRGHYGRPIVKHVRVCR